MQFGSLLLRRDDKFAKATEIWCLIIYVKASFTSVCFLGYCITVNIPVIQGYGA